MKNIIIAFFICAFAGVTSAQTAKVKVPANPNTTMYNQFIGKDMNEVMKAFNMKDTIGKTSMAYIPQVEKGIKYLLLLMPNGDRLAFKNNKMAAVLHKQ